MITLLRISIIAIIILVTAGWYCKAQLSNTQNPLLVSAEWLMQHKNDNDLVILHVSNIRSEYLGNQTCILNGGVDAWKKAGIKLSSSEPLYRKAKLNLKVKNDAIIDTTWILKNLMNKDVVIVDARPVQYFEGKSGTPRAGHIPGAVNIPNTKLYDQSNYQFVSDDKLIELFRIPEISKNSEIVTYCLLEILRV